MFIARLDVALAGLVDGVFLAAAISKAAHPAPMRVSLIWLADDLGLSIKGWSVFGAIAGLAFFEIVLGAVELAESARQANLPGLARNAGLLLTCAAIMTPLHAQPATERVHPSPERE